MSWELVIDDVETDGDELRVGPNIPNTLVHLSCLENDKEAAVLLTRKSALKLISALQDTLDDLDEPEAGDGSQ